MLVCALQCAMVLSVAGKYALDRATLPRAWVNATPVDPSLPIRGCYVSLHLQVDVPDGAGWNEYLYQPVRLQVQQGRLVAVADAGSHGLTVSRVPQRAWTLSEPVAFYLPEHSTDPSGLQPGEELWVEVSVPKSGPPRPLRLALKKDGKLTPLNFD